MEKEERRKKIISRGTDRLALITGQIQRLNADQFPKSASFASDPCHDHVPTQHLRSSSESAAANEKSLLKRDCRHGGDDVPDTVTIHDNCDDVSRRNYPGNVVSHRRQLVEKEVATLTSDNTNLSAKLLGCDLCSITLKEINFSIITSEDTRAICAVVLAILVVLSHVNLPHNVVKPKSLIAYRPLYVVLLTDVFIIATRLAPYAQIRREDKEPKFEEARNGPDWGGALKLLELGIVLHQTIRAVFIDFSFYLVIVVCGLSLV